MARPPTAARARAPLALAALALLAAAPIPGAAGPIAPPPPAGPEVLPWVVATSAEPALTPEELLGLLRRRVRYLFVLYQENRSFDSLFGTFPGADGLHARPPAETPGFDQPFVDAAGRPSVLHPFRIGPAECAADTGDVDHSHAGIVAKMDVVGDRARMDRFALAELRRRAPDGAPTLAARQFAELTMAHLDCDTIPLLWRLADRFALFDRIFQQMTGPSTPGNLSIIAAQTGLTQLAHHPEQAPGAPGDPGVPVLDDHLPRAGSALDRSPHPLPVNPRDRSGPRAEHPQLDQTYATLPLTLAGRDAARQVEEDPEADADLADLRADLPAIVATGRAPIAWRWYQEGFDREAADPGDDDGPTDAAGLHASYVTHHDGPAYFGYIAHSPALAGDLRGLGDLFSDLARGALPPGGGLFYVKGGYRNVAGQRPSCPDPAVRRDFLGDDDHPGYSDAQISEALVARAIAAIARSRYWSQSAIVVTWDDSDGLYDHVPPPIRRRSGDGAVLGDGPRVPLLLVSPYARVHAVLHDQGSHASVVKLADRLFDLPPLATLPDELRGRREGEERFHQRDMGPDDALTRDVTDLLPGFDPARLAGLAPPLPPTYAAAPDAWVERLPGETGLGCREIGVTPVDVARGLRAEPPPDFDPRPAHRAPGVPTAPAALPAPAAGQPAR